MKIRARRLAAVLFVLCATTSASYAAAGDAAASFAANDALPGIRSAVDRAIRPVMAKYGIPGLAAGVLVDGKAYVFCYGVASADTRQPVTRETLFEIGSISKTFTATLATYAQVSGYLSLSDNVSKYLPELQHSPFEIGRAHV